MFSVMEAVNFLFAMATIPLVVLVCSIVFLGLLLAGGVALRVAFGLLSDFFTSIIATPLSFAPNASSPYWLGVKARPLGRTIGLLVVSGIGYALYAKPDLPGSTHLLIWVFGIWFFVYLAYRFLFGALTGKAH